MKYESQKRNYIYDSMLVHTSGVPAAIPLTITF